MAGVVRVVRHVPHEGHLHEGHLHEGHLHEGHPHEGHPHEGHLGTAHDGHLDRASSGGPGGPHLGEQRRASHAPHPGDHHADHTWDHDEPMDDEFDECPGGDGTVLPSGPREASDQNRVGTSNSQADGSVQRSAASCPYQNEVRIFYAGKNVQRCVAGIITANFLLQCIQAQIDPWGTRHETLWLITENFFNVVFLLELILNMYGLWFRPFWRKGWNIFDFIVVGIGVLDMCQVPMGALNLARMLRAFRVFRLFGRIESLSRTISMIRKALPGVFSAFLIAIIMLAIYAVLATDLFKEIYVDCLKPESFDLNGVPYVPVAITSRGKCFGFDYYGNFLKSLYTLFQILTGESWSEAAVRPIMYRYRSDILEVTISGFFFLSFIMINGIIIVNVVVAFLIDGILGEEKKQEEEAHHLDEEADPTPQVLFDCSTGEIAEMVRDIKCLKTELDAFRRESQDVLNRVSNKLGLEKPPVTSSSV